MSRTLFDKIWDEHVVADLGDGLALLHVDRHLLHDLNGGPCLAGLRERGLKVRNPELALATPDHSIASTPGRDIDTNPPATAMLRLLRAEAEHAGIRNYELNQDGQGIVHVVGPELLGFTLPGSLLVCGDSHTCTHGGLGALAFGIGRSELTHVLATQTIYQRKPRRMRVNFDGQPGPGVAAKDLILHLIGAVGVGGGDGFAVEYAGAAIRGLSVEGRLTICNLSIELGAKIGMVAPDDVAFAYLAGRTFAPKGAAWDAAVAQWRSLPSDPDAEYDREVHVDAAAVAPQITWGNSPEDVLGIDGRIPDPANAPDAKKREAMIAALDYMGLEPGRPIAGTPVDWVFIGSCTNSRIDDLRAAAAVAYGRKVAAGIHAWVVPGSQSVKRQAEAEGLDRIFLAAGFEWREPGCSMCLAANGETVPSGARSVSTSNRNFVGRQGQGARTHLASPAMAAAAAIEGRITDVRRMGTGLVTPFTVHTGIAAPLPIANVNTDMLIRIEIYMYVPRGQLGPHCLAPLRNRPDGSPDPDFILNQPPYDQASILITGDNFGCGSSREHAVWALLDMGVRCVIGPGFGDIFYNNCFQNGLLPVVLPDDTVAALMADATASQSPFTIDLERRAIQTGTGRRVEFPIDPARRQALLAGLDEIEMTLARDGDIARFQANDHGRRPWIYDFK